MATVRPAPAVASKVFVTRASGIIGTALCGRRRELGAQVADQSNCIVSGDICVPGPWLDALVGCERREPGPHRGPHLTTER